MRVRVWWSLLAESAAARRLDCLDAPERERLGRFVNEPAAERFLLGTALARTAVWRVTGIPPAAVPLDRSCPRCGELHGPPRLRAGVGAISLSITHAGQLVGVAVCDEGEVGIDVEPLPPPPAASLFDAMRAALHPEEARELGSLADATRSAAALRTWTRKEAVLKATRLGLTVAPARLRVSVSGPPRILAWTVLPDHARRTLLADLSPAADHVATVACVPRGHTVPRTDGLVVEQADGAGLLGMRRR